MMWLARQGARFATRSCAVLARRRVPLGFVFGVLVLWLAQPTGETLAGRCRRGGGRRGAPDLGRRSSQQVARGDLVGPVSLVGASALRRIVDDGRRAGDRVGSVARGGADRGLPRRDDHGRGEERGSVSPPNVRRAATIGIERAPAARGRCAARAVQPGAGDRQPRASRSWSDLRSPCCCCSVKATYNGTFWRQLSRAGGRLAQW